MDLYAWHHIKNMQVNLLMHLKTFVVSAILRKSTILLAHQSRESAIGNNTSKGEYYPCISHSQFLSFAINVIGV
jgi:hypothetical protein